MWLLIWLGLGFLRIIILLRNPEKLVLENTFKGSMLKMVVAILETVEIIGGPITLVVSIILPKKKLCPNCYKSIRKENIICSYCGAPILDLSSAQIKHPIANPQFSPVVKAAISQGFKEVNLPIPFIMFGVWLGGAAIGALIFRNEAIIIACFPLGFILGWLWWSYKIPRWRKWALTQPGITPDELQSAAEIALLVWPKGHFFEKTEIKLKDKM